MAYRLPSERLPLPVEDGPTIEVERCASYPIQQHALGLVAACVAADPGKATVLALYALYEFFLGEAQPTWDLIDHSGPIRQTPGGMLRLDVQLGISFVEEWCSTLPVPETPPETAADAVLPPGPVRDEINARLKAKKSDPEV